MSGRWAAARGGWDTAFFALLFAGVMGPLAAARRLWFDEVLTAYVLRLGSIGRVWEALAAGVDANPPLFYAATLPAVKWLGESPLTLRWASLLGVLACCVAVQRFARTGVGPWLAWVAALLPLGGLLGKYAREARPYGLMMGFVGLALLAWRVAGRPGWRGAAGCVGLGLALAGAVGTHFYAVLVWPAIGLAEIVRTRETGRWRLGVWLALGVGGGPLLLSQPTMVAVRRLYSATFWSPPRAFALGDAYGELVGPAGWVLAASAVAVGWWLARRGGAGMPERSASIAGSDWAMAAGLALGPVVAFALAYAWTNAFTVRYLLPASLGLGLLFTYTVKSLPSSGGGLHATVFGFCAAGAIVGPAMELVREPQWFGQTALFRALTLAGPGSGEIVVANADTFLQLHHELDPATRRRLRFVRCGSNTAELILVQLSRVSPVSVEGFSQFAERNRGKTVVVIGKLGDPLPQALTLTGAELRIIAVWMDDFVGRATIQNSLRVGPGR